MSLSGSPLSPSVGQLVAVILSAMGGLNMPVVCSLVIISLGLAAPVTQITPGPRSSLAETGLRERVLAENPEKERPE